MFIGPDLASTNMQIEHDNFRGGGNPQDIVASLKIGELKTS